MFAFIYRRKAKSVETHTAKFTCHSAKAHSRASNAAEARWVSGLTFTLTESRLASICKRWYAPGHELAAAGGNAAPSRAQQVGLAGGYEGGEMPRRCPALKRSGKQFSIQIMRHC